MHDRICFCLCRRAGSRGRACGVGGEHGSKLVNTCGSVWTSPMGQYHLDKKNLAKGGAFEMRTIQMPVALATKARQGALDYPRIEAQASRRQPTGAQITQQAFHQGATLCKSHDGKFVDRLLDEGHGLAKTQAVRIHITLSGGSVHQPA